MLPYRATTLWSWTAVRLASSAGTWCCTCLTGCSSATACTSARCVAGTQTHTQAHTHALKHTHMRSTPVAIVVEWSARVCVDPCHGAVPLMLPSHGTRARDRRATPHCVCCAGWGRATQYVASLVGSLQKVGRALRAWGVWVLAHTASRVDSLQPIETRAATLPATSRQQASGRLVAPRRPRWPCLPRRPLCVHPVRAGCAVPCGAAGAHTRMFVAAAGTPPPTPHCWNMLSQQPCHALVPLAQVWP